jgi:hypothetical protein
VKEIIDNEKRKNFTWYIILISILTAILCTQSAYAISGEGIGISLRASIGQLTYYSNSSPINIIGNSNWLVGQYQGGTFSGRFGINNTLNYLDEPESNNNSVLLVSPANNSGSRNSDINFRYNVDVINVSYCSLYLNNALLDTDYSPEQGINLFHVPSMSSGANIWRVDCRNTNNIITYSETYNIVGIALSNFDNETTDLTQCNLSSVPNLTLSQSGKGKIRFSEDVNLAGVYNIESYVTIRQNSIVINSEALPQLNKPARLTFENIILTDFVILKDGRKCNECEIISNSGGTLVISVAGFSNYTVASSTSLFIYDDTDSMIKYVDQNISFYANYSNLSNSNPIIGSCSISFYIAEWTAAEDMYYNPATYLYEYTRAFNTTDTGNYIVSCTNVLGFDDLSSTDGFDISGGIPDRMGRLNASIINTERRAENLMPEVIAAQRGNISSITIMGELTTSSWQGYYGNITGKITLGTIESKIIYEWNITETSGQIYAARTPNVKWYNIECANTTELSDEDTYLGIDSSHGESIYNTFFNTTSFSPFSVGNISINSSQNCYATNLYNASGIQNEFFSEVLLSDSSKMIYTAIINNDVSGFDSRTHDFEIIVAERGKDDYIPTTYYFFAEIK